jgi:hypothetical protein
MKYVPINAGMVSRYFLNLREKYIAGVNHV